MEQVLPMPQVSSTFRPCAANPRAAGPPPEKMVGVDLRGSKHLLRIWLEPKALGKEGSGMFSDK